MIILFPANPENLSEPDDIFKEEYIAARSKSIHCALFDFELFLETKTMKVNMVFFRHMPVIYRGFMLSQEDFIELRGQVLDYEGDLITSFGEYTNMNYLSGWYRYLKEYTPKTVDIDSNPITVNGISPPYFIKDDVKSNTMSFGSIANTVADIKDIVTQLASHRTIEYPLHAREYIKMITGSERRYFVIYGEVFSKYSVPDVVYSLVDIIKINHLSNFYTLDIATNSKGHDFLVEAGDGQVSDLKNNDPYEFYSHLKRIITVNFRGI